MLHDVEDMHVRKIISDAYNPEKSYAVGDYCIRDNTLYKCIEETTDVWNSTSWEATNVGSEVSGLTNSLTSFSVHPVYPNYETINSGYTSGGFAYQKGNFVTLKFSFEVAHFDVTKPLCVVPDNIKPSQNVNALFRGYRIGVDPTGYCPIFADGNCYIDTDGKLWQRFNSDGSATDWSGDIFVEYPIN